MSRTSAAQFYKNIFIPVFILAFLISSCNLPRRSETPAPGDVETQVVELLTAIPTVTILPTSTKIPPSATPQPTKIIPTETKTPTVQPSPTSLSFTPTPVSTDIRTTLGNPTFADNMSNGGGFLTYTDDHVKFDPEDEEMLMVAASPDSWHGWSLSGTTLKDAYIEMTATPGNCSGKDRYGLVVRSPDPTQGYFFGFSCDGMYSLRKWDGSEFTAIVDWTTSDKIFSGSTKTNRLGIKTQGSHFTFYANGNQIGEADDSSYTEGKLGIFIASSATTDFSATVDEVDYWLLQ